MNTLTTQIAENQEVKTISVSELYNMIVSETKSTIANVVYLVDHAQSVQVKGKKQIQKLVQVSHVYFNHDYTKKVNNYIKKAIESGLLTEDEVIAEFGSTEFKAKPLNGKTRISSTILQSDKTKAFMIDGRVLKSETANTLALFHNGEEITEAQAIAQDLWTNSYYNPTPKKTKGRGILPKELDFGIINTYLDRIVEIKMDGVSFKVKPMVVIGG